MNVLGAVLAGGQSRRFGSDKALATFRGATLMERVCTALRPHCRELVIVGRADGVPDYPAANLGPLGGLGGALQYAAAKGFSHVLTCSVDGIFLPSDLLEKLLPGPSHLARQPVIGLWHSQNMARLATFLEGNARRSVYEFAASIGSRPIEIEQNPENINWPSDLSRLESTDVK